MVGVKTWRMENRVENGIFHCLVEKRKQERQKIGWKIFPLDPPFFIFPIYEENGEEKVLKDALYTNTLNLLISHVTWWLLPLHPYHFTFTAQQRPRSLLSLSLSLSLFFLPRLISTATWPNQVDTFYCFLSLLYSSLIYCFLMPTFLLPSCPVKLLVQDLIYTSFSASWFAQLNY